MNCAHDLTYPTIQYSRWYDLKQNCWPQYLNIYEVQVVLLTNKRIKISSPANPYLCNGINRLIGVAGQPE